MTSALAPLNDAIIHAVCRLVDDYGNPREPAHSQIGFEIERAGLAEFDPGKNPKPVGKERRLRQVLTMAQEQQVAKGQLLVGRTISLLQGCGGFMEGGPNYAGHDAVAIAQEAFKGEGWELAWNGDLGPLLLDGVTGAEAEIVLRGYVRRLRRNPDDSPLVVGTSKDLLEATAKHVLLERWGAVPDANFPGLLGQAFTALEMATRHGPKEPGEAPQRDIERAYYELGCSVNRLRNKEGTGKGNAFLPTVTPVEARAACQAMALISDYMLDALKN